MTFARFATYVAVPDRQEELVGVFLRAAALLEQNADCLHFLVGTAQGDDAVWVSELWTDRAAHDASVTPDDVRSVLRDLRTLIAQVSEQRDLVVRGGKGAPR